MAHPAPLSVHTLREEVEDGRIDTVLSRSPTCRAGSRASARRPVLPRRGGRRTATEGCNYLLAVDVDMNTVDGYAMSSWERGYGDFVLMPDLDTLRRVPWLPGTALVPCDLLWLDGTPWSPRRARCSSGSSTGSTERGLRRLRRHRAGVHRLRGHLRGGLEEGYRDLTPPTTTTSTTRCSARARVEPLLRDIRNGMDGAGMVVRVGQGRVQPRPARDRVPLHRRAGHVRQPLGVQDRRQGDRRPARQA